MSAQSAYRSTHPDVLAAFRAAEKASNDYADAMFAALAAHGMAKHQAAVNSSSLSQGGFLGVVVADGEELPAGWRRKDVRGQVLAVPDKRTKAGKSAAAALNALERPGSCPLPGMPDHLRVADGGGIRFCTPGVRLLEDGTAVWVTWSTVIEAATDLRGNGVPDPDEALWENPRLSAYWAAIEAADGKPKPVLTRSN